MAKPSYHSLWPALALAALLVCAAGCGAARPAPAAPAEAAPAEAATAETAVETGTGAAAAEVAAAYPLAATSWSLDYFGSQEQPVPMLEETRASVTFFWDRYAGFDGCNFFMGVYEAADGALLTDMPARTIEFCEPDQLEEQAAMFSSALLNARGYTREGEQLAVTTEGGGRILTFSPASPAPLLGTVWDLRFWWSPDFEEWQPVIVGSTTTITFAAGGEASGSGGCNDYTVPYAGDLQAAAADEAAATFADLPALTFGPLSAQAATCAEPEGIMDQEQSYFAQLGAVASYFSLGSTLLLLDADGNSLLIFAARV